MEANICCARLVDRPRAPFGPGAVIKRNVALADARQRKQKIAAVTPEPQVVITGRSTSTPAFAMRVLISLAGIISPDWTTSRHGKLKLPGIWPERNPGRGSAAVPANRAAARASRICGEPVALACCTLLGAGNGGAIEFHGEGPGHAPHRTLFEGALLGPPSGQTASKDFYVPRAEHTQGPPDAGAPLQVGGVVDDEPHFVAEAELFHRLGKGGRAWQHMRQIRRMIGDRIDVEEDRAGDMPVEIFRLGICGFRQAEKTCRR